MENELVHEIELYSPETFRTLMEHEVNRSHRYGDSLTLIDLIVEADPAGAQNQHNAELLTIDALNVHLRKTDIPCKRGNEFLILMPATGTQGTRTACERIKKLMTINHQAGHEAAFQLRVWMGLATLPNEDRSVSSDRLAQNATQALQHARANQITSVVSFSDLSK